MIDLAPQIDYAVSFVCFFIPIKRMRSSNLSRIETNLPYCLIAGVQCDDVRNHTGLSSLVQGRIENDLLDVDHRNEGINADLLHARLAQSLHSLPRSCCW